MQASHDSFWCSRPHILILITFQDDPSPEPFSAIIAFGSRNDADKWWREMCKAMLSSRTRWSLQRESPELYVGDADVIVAGIRNGDSEITQEIGRAHV